MVGRQTGVIWCGVLGRVVNIAPAFFICKKELFFFVKFWGREMGSGKKCRKETTAVDRRGQKKNEMSAVVGKRRQRGIFGVGM